MFITKKHLSRRTMLRGMGASVALPLLDAMIPAATALANTAAKPKPRMGFIYFPHGAVMERWSPKADGHGVRADADPEAARAVSAERPHVVSGLRNKGGESSDPHAHHGRHVARLRRRRSRRQAPNGGITADQLAAQHIGQDTPMPSLEIAGEGGGARCATRRCGCGYRRNDGVPHAVPAAADGEQSAQGVLRHVRPGRHGGRARGACSRRAAACSTT